MPYNRKMRQMAEKIKLIRLEETDSTNRYLSQYRGDEGQLMTIVTARHQTAGRGQGTHTWESERGKNLLFSIKTTPKALPLSRKYIVMQAEALAILEMLRRYGEGFTIKWPNDIYWHDKKISGTLSESSIVGNTIKCVILGTGINVNQETFHSDAPNPISLCSIIGRQVDVEGLLREIVDAFATYINMVNNGEYDAIHNEYMLNLYRRTGNYKFMDIGGEFVARIENVRQDGKIVLLRQDGKRSEYDFCELRFVP